MMRILLKLFQLLYAVYAMLLFVALMIPVFVWSVAVLPFGRIRSGNLIYRGCMVWADIWFFLVAMPHRNYGSVPASDDSYIYVCNHISYLDSALIPKAIRHPVRPLGKVEMSRIPIFGFIYRNTIVTVDRSSPGNRAKSVQILKSLLRKGVSILVFPEGTFNTTGEPLKDFYDGAFRIAIETGTPIKPFVLLDAKRRMHYSSIFSLNPGRSRALFLDEVQVEGKTVEELKTKVWEMMAAEIRKDQLA